MARSTAAVNAHSWNNTYWHDLKHAWNTAPLSRVAMMSERDRAQSDSQGVEQ
jgi:hypothetical protein